jgi:hypothetical protein
MLSTVQRTLFSRLATHLSAGYRLQHPGMDEAPQRNRLRRPAKS